MDYEKLSRQEELLSDYTFLIMEKNWFLLMKGSIPFEKANYIKQESQEQAEMSLFKHKNRNIFQQLENAREDMERKKQEEEQQKEERNEQQPKSFRNIGQSLFRSGQKSNMRRKIIQKPTFQTIYR